MAHAQNTVVTGTFRPPSGQTPAAAGLRSFTVGATAMCGTLTFTPYDSAGRKVITLTYQGITYFPQPETAYVRCSDGALMDKSGTAAQIRLIPNINSTPSGTVYRLDGSLSESIALGPDGAPVLPETRYLNLQKVVPDQASVDWGALAVAGITALSYTGISGIQDEGTPVVFYPTLNFIGAGVACVANAGQLRIDCTFSGGGGGAALTVEEVDGAPSIASVDRLRFNEAAGFVVSNPSANIAQVTLAGVPDTALADILSANKVGGPAFKLLGSIPPGAGIIPAANLPGTISYLGASIESAEITDGTVAAADLAAGFLDAAGDIAAGLCADNQLLKKVSGAWVCAADDTGAGGGFPTIQEEGASLTVRGTLNFTGAALTASDNAGATRTDIALSQSPAGSASVVGIGRLLTCSTGLTGCGDLSADRTLSVVADSTTQRLDFQNNVGTVVGTRKALQFLTGGPISYTVSDDAGGNRVTMQPVVSTSPAGAGTVVGSARQINTSAPLTGGGALSSDLTFSIIGITAQSGSGDTMLRVTLASLSSGQLCCQWNGSAWGNYVNSYEFLDSQFRVVGSADGSKKYAIEVDGFTAGVLRTFTPPDRDMSVFGAGAKYVTTDLAGNPTTDNCAKWLANGVLGDAGAGCGGAGGGDSLTVNAVAATDLNIIDVTATATVAGITWTLNTAPSPDTLSLSISAASGSVAGIVTANAQTLGGAKTFSGGVLTDTISKTSGDLGDTGLVRLAHGDILAAWENSTPGPDSTLRFGAAVGGTNNTFRLDFVDGTIFEMSPSVAGSSLVATWFGNASVAQGGSVTQYTFQTAPCGEGGGGCKAGLTETDLVAFRFGARGARVVWQLCGGDTVGLACGFTNSSGDSQLKFFFGDLDNFTAASSIAADVFATATRPTTAFSFWERGGQTQGTVNIHEWQLYSGSLFGAGNRVTFINSAALPCLEGSTVDANRSCASPANFTGVRVWAIPDADSTTAVYESAATTNQWVTHINSSGVAVKAQPGFTNVSGSIALAQIPDDLITYAKLQNVSATARLLGRITAGAGDIEELTGTQATTLLDVFTSSLKGLVPASGGGTTNFLRADGAWAAPAGGGSGDALEVEAGDNGGTFDTIDTTARLEDQGDIDFQFTDGGAGGPDTIIAVLRANSVALSTDTTGNYVADVTAGAGLAKTSSAGEGQTVDLAVVSDEADFLKSGALTCGAATQGKMQVHTTPLQYCDNAATPALQYAAYGDSAGAALAGDSATGFFASGTVEDARLSANVSLLGGSISLTAEVIGTLPVANGGTGATTTAEMRESFELLPRMSVRRLTLFFPLGSAASLGSIGDRNTNLGTTLVGNAADANNGAAVSYPSTGGTGDNFGLEGDLIYRVGRNVDGTWRVHIPTQTSVRFWCGFTSDTGANMAASDGPTAHIAAFRFSTDASDTNLQACTNSNAAGVTCTDTGTAPSSTTGQDLRIQMRDGTPDVVFYINGTSVVTATTDLPASGNNLRYVCGGETRTTAARNLLFQGAQITVDK